MRDDTGRFLRESDIEPGGRTHVCFARETGTGRLLAYDTSRGAWLTGNADAELRARVEITTASGTISCRSAFDLYAAAAAEYPPARVQEITGVGEADLANAAEILATSPTVAYYAWNGVGQSVTATQTDRAISLLYALTGSYGKRAATCLAPQSPSATSRARICFRPSSGPRRSASAERPLGPSVSGWVTARDVYRAVLNGDPYPVRVLVSFGTNLLVSQPDLPLATRAFEQLEFHVHADFFINATARYADIVLPVATSWEREGLRAGFDVTPRWAAARAIAPACHCSPRRGALGHGYRAGARQALGARAAVLRLRCRSGTRRAACAKRAFGRPAQSRA